MAFWCTLAICITIYYCVDRFFTYLENVQAFKENS